MSVLCAKSQSKEFKAHKAQIDVQTNKQRDTIWKRHVVDHTLDEPSNFMTFIKKDGLL